MPLSQLRLVLPEVRSFHRPALQSADHVCHTAAVDALGIDLSRAFTPKKAARSRSPIPARSSVAIAACVCRGSSITAMTRFVRFRRVCPLCFVFVWLRGSTSNASVVTEPYAALNRPTPAP
jgi:hypothetical protein